MTWIFLIVIGSCALLLGLFYFNNRTNASIRSGGQTRRYLLYVPDSYDPEMPAPLVISIHGFVQWPAHQQRLSGWNQLADKEGFLVVYPKGTGFPLRWNALPIVADTDKSLADVRFFEDLIDQLSSTFNLDRSRIYVNGMSNGGGMANLLACELPGSFAAFGGVAGAYLCPVEMQTDHLPVPWIVFHGVDDPIVPYRGGETNRHNRTMSFPPIKVWVADWAQASGCQPEPEKEEITPQVSRFTYRGCEGNVELILYRIAGAGHTWPGGGRLPRWLTGKINREIDATNLMWEFFRKYRLTSSKAL